MKNALMRSEAGVDKRCSWVNVNDPLLLEYHDREWGVPVHSDPKHFEGVVLSGAQAAQKPFIVPIPGTRSVDHLHENLRAVDVQLTPADLREIETALSKIEVHGGRMNEERMTAVDQTT